MRLKYWFTLGGCLLAASLVTAFCQGDTLAFSSAEFTTVQPPSFTGTKGWSFYNYNQAGTIWITQLGVFDSGTDGLVNAHQIGLWRADGTLLASATVPPGASATMANGYRYVPITPVPIPRATSVFNQNGAYIIAAQYSVGDADDLLTPLNGGLAYGIGPWTSTLGSAGWYGHGANLPFPSTRTTPPSEGTLGPAFWEPNFQFTIPEPATCLLLAPALFLVLMRRRKAP